jgi:hypothetical protein
VHPEWDCLPVRLTISWAERRVLIGVALVIVMAVVAVALVRLTRPHWPLAVLAAGASLATFAETVVDMGRTHPRYVIPAALFLYVAIVALLRPAPPGVDDTRTRFPRWSWLPVAAFGILLAVVCAVNLRVPNSRSRSQGWHVTASQARRACATTGTAAFEYRYTWWAVVIPCDRVR